jgi:5'-nucleotidase
MAYDLSAKLVVAVSSRALFDLEQENRIYETQGIETYRRHQIDHAREVLKPGVGFPFIKRLLSLNALIPGYAPVEVILLSRNDPDTGMRAIHSIEAYGLAIERAAFLGGGYRMKYLEPFHVALFLSANPEDVRMAVDEGHPAGQILQPAAARDDGADGEFRLAFDFDGVLASDEAERVYAASGLHGFEAHERERQAEVLSPGPLHAFIRGISEIQRREMAHYAGAPDHAPVVRTAVITSRAAPAHLRAMHTLRAWGIRVDEALFLGGIGKQAFLERFRPHIFFDDQLTHLAGQVGGTAAVHIPYGVRNRVRGQ